MQISTFWRPGERRDDRPGAGRRPEGRPERTPSRFPAVASDAARRAAAAPARRSLAAADARLAERRVADLRDRDLAQLADGARSAGRCCPPGSEGYRKAEVTAGGVDTRELDSRSGESRRVPGLYFIGEVVDVTGWLGGYNFQWAWASAAACARALGQVYARRRNAGL